MSDSHPVDPAGHITADPTGRPVEPSPVGRVDWLAAATDPDPLVAGEILHDYQAPPGVVEALARTHPQLAELAGGHPNAPVALKDAVPVREHSDLALDRYVQARGGSTAQRHALLFTHRGSPDPLGVVWERDVAHL